jgi:GT2 family glycosyltransferase
MQEYSMSEDVRLSVVIPCYRRPDPLTRCLQELSTQDVSEPFEVIVVDDGSPEPLGPTIEAMKRKLPVPLSCVRQANGGPGAARNTGARRANGSCLLLLDDDLSIAPDFLRLHLEAQKRVGPAAISADFTVHASMDDPELGRWYAARAARWAEEAERVRERVAPGIFRVPGQLLSSTNLCIPRQDYLEAGGFDTAYGAPSCEDMDLGVRLTKRGFPIYRITTTQPVHLEPRSTLAHLCARQRSGARETVRLVYSHPEVFGEPAIARVNGPLRPTAEPLAVSAKKVIRSILGHRTVAPLAIATAAFLSRARTPPGILHPFYEAIVSAQIQSGWREGLTKWRAPKP